MADPRGNLMLTYLAMADKFKPKWLLWENVPGVLSSNRGSDFAALLQGLAQLGYGFAYRVLDAQYFGVPQRRRRVFVVGCLGDWRSAAKVLFESESLCRDITPRRSKKQGASDWPKNCASTLNASFGNKQGLENQHINSGAPLFVPTVYETHPADSRVKEMGDVCQTITSSWGTGGGNVPIATAYNITFCDANGTRKDRPDNGLYVNETDTSNTLTRAGVGTNALQNMRVRRLTPIECERLQGFPDNYTNTPTSSDSTRYKALGNSMAVPVMKWIGERINEVEKMG